VRRLFFANSLREHLCLFRKNLCLKAPNPVLESL